MRKRLTIAAIIFAIAGLTTWLWLARRPATEDGASSAAGFDKNALIEKKRAARAGGQIDLSPASAMGKVTRAVDGTPIAGAVVVLTPKGFSQGQSSQPGQPEDPILARSDGSGNWELARVLPGRYTLSAAADGYLTASNVDVVLQAGQRNEGLDLSLHEGGHTLSGTISDIGGGPIEAVLLQVVRLDEGSLLKMTRAVMPALTDEDGRYRLQVPDGDYAMTTFHTDYVADNRLTSVRDGPRTEDFRLVPGGAIEGVVVARGDRKPVGGAVVTYTASRGALESAGVGFSIGGMGDGRVIADDEGRFRLRGLQSGVVRISAVADGYASREATEVALGVAEQVSEIEVEVERAYKISGFVVRKGAEESGIEGVLVGAFTFQPPSLFGPKQPSESDGHFEVLGVPPGMYTVGALGDQALPNLMGTSAQVIDKDVENVLVVMDPGVTVAGRVEPPTEARINVQVDAEEMSFGTMLSTLSNSMVQARADQDGVFALKPVSPGTLKLVATAEDGRKGEVEVQVGDQGAENVIIRLDPRAQMSGRVLDSTGKPVAGVNVVMNPKNKAPSMGAMMRSGLGEGVATGEDGGYVVRGLEEGAYLVMIKDRKSRVVPWARPHDPEKPLAPLEVEVRELEDKRGVDFAIEARNGVIRGTVLDAEGAPLADAWVTAMRESSIEEVAQGWNRGDDDESKVKAKVRKKPTDEDGENGRAMSSWLAETPALTDEAGNFVIRELRAGKYTVVAEGLKGSARAKQEGVEPGAVVRLQLERVAGLAGRVTRKGTKVTEYQVAADGPTSRSKTVRNDDGTFVIDRIDPGEYKIKVTAKEGIGEETVTVDPGKTTDVVVELRGYGKVHGVLVDGNGGKPLAGVMLMLTGSDMNPGAIMSMFTGVGPRTDASGRFRVDDVAPGKHRLVFFDRDAMMAGGTVASVEFQIAAEETKDLGTVQGIASSKIPPDERGELGLDVWARSYAERPLAPGDDDKNREDDDAAGDDSPSNEPKRLWVFSVTKDGPAAAAGIDPGDEIVGIDGRGVSGMGADVASSLLSPAHIRAGQTVSIEIDREGSRKTLSVKANPRPQK